MRADRIAVYCPLVRHLYCVEWGVKLYSNQPTTAWHVSLCPLQKCAVPWGGGDPGPMVPITPSSQTTESISRMAYPSVRLYLLGSRRCGREQQVHTDYAAPTVATGCILMQCIRPSYGLDHEVKSVLSINIKR